MKIAFFTENSYKGGLDTFLINLFNAWPNEDDLITFICNKSHPGLKTISNQTRRKIAIQTYDYFYTTSIALGQSQLFFSRWILIRTFFVLSQRLLQYLVLCPWYLITLTYRFRKSDFDKLQVVNGGYPASLLCRCAAIAWGLSGKKSKVIFNFHNYAVPAKWHNRIFENWIDKQVHKNSAFVISVTNHCLQSIKLRKHFCNSHKLSFIYNGIEVPLNEHVFKNDGKYCLMLATYEPRKGHLFLLKAFKKVVTVMPNIRLRVFGYAGKQHEKRVVEEEIRRLDLGNHVELNDFTEQKNELIANASVLVVPSQSEESFGLTIIEAMALGTPVVTTNIGGMPEVISDSGAGLVCFSNDPDSLAASILQILKDENLARSMSLSGIRAFKNKYDAKIMAKEYYIKIKSA
jgi:glycosyltransferase involved in cell wall biosynthesis